MSNGTTFVSLCIFFHLSGSGENLQDLNLTSPVAAARLGKKKSWSLSRLCRARLCFAALGWAKEFTAERLPLVGDAAAGRLNVSKHSLRCVATLRCVIGCLPDAPLAPRCYGNDTLTERSSGVISRLHSVVGLRNTCTDIYGWHDDERRGWGVDEAQRRSCLSILLNYDRQRFFTLTFGKKN